jgi:hypothetical protein
VAKVDRLRACYDPLCPGCARIPVTIDALPGPQAHWTITLSPPMPDPADQTPTTVPPLFGREIVSFAGSKSSIAVARNGSFEFNFRAWVEIAGDLLRGWE